MTILYILAAIVTLLLAWRLALAICTKTADVYHYVKTLELDRQGRRRYLDEPTQVNTDSSGTFPLLRDPVTKRVLDVERGLVLDNDGLLSWSPIVHEWAAKRRALQAIHFNISGGDPVGGLLEAPRPDVQWPKLVDLRGEFTDHEPTLNDLVVGVYPDESGERQRLSASIHDLMHVLVVGATGWGKSSWLRSLLWQVARAREPVDVVAVDVSGAEFNTLGGWSRLRYPVAKETQDAAALLQEANQELTQRKALYETHPTASKLTEYNRLADEPLNPWLILIDEGAVLLNDSKVGDLLRRGVQQARQYGLYYVISGVSADHRTIETRTRDQFSTRLCFRTSPTSSRVVLDDGGASSIKAKGRALAQLVGRELQEIQAAYITKDELAKVLTGGGPRHPMPKISGNGGTDPETVKRIKALHAEGVGLCAICDTVFGYHNAVKTAVVKDILGLD